MKEKIKVSKVVLDINNKEIELSLEEAKELFKILKEFFDSKEKEYVWVPHFTPYIYPPQDPYSSTYTITYCSSSEEIPENYVKISSKTQ